MNKELDRGGYTYDYQGRIMLQNAGVAEQIPPDFKFKYRFKKPKGGRSLRQALGKNSKAQAEFLKDSRQTGFQPADGAKLSKLVDNAAKNVQNVKQTAGSMFDFIQPVEAGVTIKEDKKMKGSRKEYQEVVGLMSLEEYQKKINVSN